MTKQEIKRLPPISMAYRILHPGYGTCGICHLPWSNCKSHSISLNNYEGFFPVCEYCWKHSSLSDIIQAVKRLYAEWERQGSLPTKTEGYFIERTIKAKQDEWDAEVTEIMKRYFAK